MNKQPKNQTSEAAQAVLVKKYESRYQAASLFTVRLWFKDGNKRTMHSWRQEVFPQKDGSKKIDHAYCWRRMKDIVMEKEFYYNHRCINIYCNITGNLVLKSVYGKVKVVSGLEFYTTKKGNSLLLSIESIHGKETIINEVREHCKRNLEFVALNP